MRFNVATALVALSSAAFVGAKENCGGTAGSNMCDCSTFNNGADIQIAQATVEDCQALIKSLNPNWTTSVTHAWTRIKTVGTCAFSVRVIAGSSNGLIGGADMIDLTKDSITQFQQSGRVSSHGQYGQVVSSEGEMNCNITPNDTYHQIRVEWMIASSAYNPPN